MKPEDDIDFSQLAVRRVSLHANMLWAPEAQCSVNWASMKPSVSGPTRIHSWRTSVSPAVCGVATPACRFPIKTPGLLWTVPPTRGQDPAVPSAHVPQTTRTIMVFKIVLTFRFNKQSTSQSINLVPADCGDGPSVLRTNLTCLQDAFRTRMDRKRVGQLSMRVSCCPSWLNLDSRWFVL